MSSTAADYLAGLKDKRRDYLDHARQINAQVAIFGRDDGARALADTREHHAYAADCILNLLRARLPGRPAIAAFDFQWPRRISADQVRHLCSLHFRRDASNVVFIGGVGLGKTHLAAAPAAACEQRRNALFTTAAVRDRVSHHGETIVSEGPSYRTRLDAE